MNTVICAIAKNENLYINDWVNYHLALGFDHIYLFDNNNSNSPAVNSCIDAIDHVTIIDVKDIHKDNFQIECYNNFYQKYNKTFDWCAFIDIDEYINLNGHQDIKVFLADNKFKNFNALRLNWQLFDDNNLITRDLSVPVYEAFTHKVSIPGMTQGKMIIRGYLTDIKIVSCHYALQYNDVVSSCMADGIKTKDKVFMSRICTRACINHYMTKTISEFIDQKLYRGDACFANRQLDLDYFWSINQKTEEKIQYAQSVLAKTIYYWSPAIKAVDNVGDIITYYLLKWMGYRPIYSKTPDMIGAGSILGFKTLQDKKISVWGSGLLNATDIPFSKAKANYFAVRGKKTAEILHMSRLPIGDPGLLISRYYTPTTAKKYKFGIITHFTDYDYIKQIAGDNFPYPIINTFIPNTEEAVKQFFNTVNECEFIFSSSLHGLIFAHALGIPAVHIKNLNNKHALNPKVISQDCFKFKDYYSALDIEYSNIPFTDNLDFIHTFDFTTAINFKPTNINLIQDNLLAAFNTMQNTKYNYAYYTFLSSDNYLPLVLNLYKSLQEVNSKFPLYCGLTENISLRTAKILNTVGIPYFILDTTDIEKSNIIRQAGELGMSQKWINALSKLALFTEERFDKIIYLDADLQIFENIDNLFDYPHMSAVFDLAPVKKHTAYKCGESIFCSGLLVWDFEHNHGLGKKIINNLNKLPAGIQWHDQNILNFYYKTWISKDELHLPPTYGLMSLASIERNYKQKPKVRHFITPVKLQMPFNKPVIIEPELFGCIYNYFNHINNTLMYFNKKYNLSLQTLTLANLLRENTKYTQTAIEQTYKEEEKDLSGRWKNAYLYF